MENQKQFKKIDAQLLQYLMEVIAQSHTKLTFLEIQELFKAVQGCEDVEPAVEAEVAE